LDKLVIKEIMHHVWDDGEKPRCKICGVWKDWLKPTGCEYKPYSTDISAAWLVVEEMPPPFQIHRCVDDTYWVIFWFDTMIKPHMMAKTAPEAICKAALLAKLESKDD